MTANKATTVVLIVVDGLRKDRFSRLKDYPEFEFLRGLASRGFEPENFRTVGCPTQFSFPTIFCSGLPLDFGGYDFGIRNRPVSFVEVLQQNGFRSVAATQCLYVSEFGSYERGFDLFFNDVNVGQLLRTFNEFRLRFLRLGSREDSQLRQQVKAFLESYVPYLCRQLESNSEESLQFGTKPNHIGSAKSILRALSLDPEQTIRRFLDGALDFEVEPRSIQLKTLRYGLWIRLGDFLVLAECFVLELAQLLRMKRLSRFSAGTIKQIYAQALSEIFRGPQNQHAISLVSRVVKEHSFQSHNFLFLHLAGVHDRAIRRVRVGARLPSTSLRRRLSLAFRSFLSGSTDLLYDLAALEVDSSLVSLMKQLNEITGQKVSYVLTSDHGIPVINDPNRTTPEVTARDFFETLYTIPLIIDHESSDLRSAVTQMYSTADIPDLILQICGVSTTLAPTRRESATPQGGLFHIAEHLGPGVCDFHSKNVHLCVVGNSTKVVLRFPPVLSYGPPEILECYDLAVDPHESLDLADYLKTEELELHFRIGLERWLKLRRDNELRPSS